MSMLRRECAELANGQVGDQDPGPVKPGVASTCADDDPHPENDDPI